MGKKLLSLCMILVLCLNLLPVTALAAAEGAPNSLYVGNQQVISSSDITYWTTDESTGGLTKYEGNNDNWNVKYDQSTATLSLKNAKISGGNATTSPPYGSGIYAQGNSNQPVALTIELIGENTITGTFGIYVNAEINASSYGTDASLTITSENNGSLQVSGLNDGIYVKSGTGNASLNIKNVAVTSSTNDNYAAGVYVMSSNYATNSPNISLSVDGGSLTASGTGSSDGIQFYVGSSQANNATTSLTVSENAIVDARNGGIKALKISETLPTPTPTGDNRSGIVFDGSTGTVYGDVTLDEPLTVGEGETLTIPQGSTLNTNNNLTNNGTIVNKGTLEGNLTGGTVVTTPAITTDSLPEGTVNQPYTATLTATGNNIAWSVSGDLPAGLKLSDDGKITGTPATEGSSTFTVKAENSAGSATQEYTLKINPTPTVSVTGVKLNQSELSLFTGDTATLTAMVQPENATNKAVTWASSNPSVATVENGVVTAVGAGTATITVATVDGGKTAACAVTVEKPYTPPPYIPPSKPNWTSVARKLANAQPGDTVTVKMNGETEVPGEVWETIAGRDVTVVLDMGGNVSWTVDGNDVPTATHFADMDFGVDRNTTGIDVDVINAITGEVSSVQITLAHDGEFGFALTLTAPLGRENAGYWANLYHYDENAKTLNYETSAQVASDGTASLRMTHASQYAIVIDDKSHDLPFADLGEGQWYESAVRYAYTHDIMEGMSATTFQPNGTLSRAMAVQIFYNLEGQPDISGENLGYPYEDVNAQAWYGDAVYWARITGVATGYGDGTFQPTDSITRQEFAQMLYNYAKYKGYDLTAEGDLSQFPDSGSVADWAEAAMSWANGNELINGHDDGTIDAAGTGTRAQAASILMRFDQNLVEK